jgi:hypothetical protein
MKKSEWLKGRAQAVFDNVLGWLAALLIAAAVGSAIAFGGKRVTVRGWEVILLIAILVAILGCLIVLMTRGASPSSSATRRKGKHDKLLTQLDALESDLSQEPTGTAGWPVAERYNALLAKARRACPEGDFSGLNPVEQGENPQYAETQASGLRTLVGQVRAVLDDS